MAPSLSVFALTICRPILFATTVLGLLVNMQSVSDIENGTVARPFHFEYTTITGYFLQSENSTDDSKFDFKTQNFGLINRTYETDGAAYGGSNESIWTRFERYAQHLNDQSAEDESYKVIFLGRHGQGYHNVAESKYGTPAWDCYWSMLDGAGNITWADAKLTDLGADQARDVYQLWKTQLPNGIPAPETYYVSPLTRAIQTAELTFKDLNLPSDRPYKPLIKELLREAIGVHTCDRRSPASEIAQAFPDVTFEANFSEPDPLWTADYREPQSARNYRLGQLMDDVFAHDDGVFLSFTSHSGAIGSILQVVGHRQFALATGGVIPVFLRAKKVEGERVKPPHEPSDGPPACTEPPVPGRLA